jgi:hypothetical protein
LGIRFRNIEGLAKQEKLPDGWHIDKKEPVVKAQLRISAGEWPDL